MPISSIIRRSFLISVASLLVLASPIHASAQLKVVISGGFAQAYREVLPEFERTSGVKVTTGSGSSQGQGPETIRAQLRRGTAADVVIMGREGLNELISEGRIVAGTDVDLAQTLIGLAVRSGAPKPDIGTVDAFVRTLLRSKSIAIPSSTSGIYLTTKLFPSLGIADRIALTVTARGSESTSLVASGRAEIAIQPVSEILHVTGIALVGPIPADIQFVSVFAAAVVTDSQEQDAARRLIAFLASERVSAALKNNGMDPPRKR